MRLQGKIAVVTGAASGIGRATAEMFISEGAQVVAVDRNAAAAADLESMGGRALKFVAADVTQLDQLKLAIDSASQTFGGLHILFNNAGAGGTLAGVETFDSAAWDATQALLLRSVVAGTAYAVPHMKRAGGGSIINTSSISALQAGYAPIAYSVAKAAVLHYTRLAATELSPQNIRINAVVPGFIATNIFGSGFGLEAIQSDELRKRVSENSGKANPIQRSGQPKDIAEAVTFLASDAASFITGTHLTVDGGITIGPRHSWDLSAPTPMTETLGLTRAQLIAMRDAQK